VCVYNCTQHIEFVYVELLLSILSHIFLYDNIYSKNKYRFLTLMVNECVLGYLHIGRLPVKTRLEFIAEIRDTLIV
jgi:hypothetical protein